MMLDKKHAYYYQVQMQMAVTKYPFCFFVMWSAKDMYIEKVEFSESFWNDKSQIAQKFHKRVVLPELLGRQFTKETPLEVEALPSTTRTTIYEPKRKRIEDEVLYFDVFELYLPITF